MVRNHCGGTQGSLFDLPLMDVVKQARAEFTIAKATGFLAGTLLAPTNLVISHRLREQLNRQCNDAEVAGRDDAQQLTLAQFKIKPTPNANCPQDAWFWPGQNMLACCNGRKLRNGRMYTIVSLGKDDTSKITVQADDEPPITLLRVHFFRDVRLPYAATYVLPRAHAD